MELCVDFPVEDLQYSVYRAQSALGVISYPLSPVDEGIMVCLDLLLASVWPCPGRLYARFEIIFCLAFILHVSA